MIVLTGGAGFIGSCFLKELNDNGISNIIVVDRLGTKNKWKNLRNKKFLRFFHKDDFRSKIQSGYFKDSIDTIIHFGACSSTTENDADYLFDNNLSYSIELAEYAERFGLDFIYASSAATYGDGSKGYSDDRFEDLLPLNCYGMTKHLFDKWILDHDLQKKFTGLKFFNVFGPNEYHKTDMASMVYKSYFQAKHEGVIRLFKSNSDEFADGEQKRDFIYVKDVNKIIYDILNKNHFSGIFNIGTGKAHTWNELARAVFKALGKKPVIEYIDMPEEISSQYQNFTQAEMQKLKSSSLEPHFSSLEESVDDYISNHLSQNNPYY